MICSRARLDGYSAALAERNIPTSPELITEGDFTTPGGYEGANFGMWYTSFFFFSGHDRQDVGGGKPRKRKPPRCLSDGGEKTSATQPPRLAGFPFTPWCSLARARWNRLSLAAIVRVRFGSIAAAADCVKTADAIENVCTACTHAERPRRATCNLHPSPIAPVPNYTKPRARPTRRTMKATTHATTHCKAKTATAQRGPSSFFTAPMAATHGG